MQWTLQSFMRESNFPSRSVHSVEKWDGRFFEHIFFTFSPVKLS